MATIAISVPSGAHHRSLLQPMREVLAAQSAWNYLIISPGTPWADQLFPALYYPRDRYAFVEKASAADALENVRPALVITPTAGLDPEDVPILEKAKSLDLRSLTVVESWDNVWKMDFVARGLGKGGQKIILADHLAVWNAVMADHLLRVFPRVRRDRVSVVGAPRLDYFGPDFADQLPSRQKTFEFFGLNPEQRVLHLATTELYDHGHVAKKIGEAKRRGELPTDLQLYASVHPGGNMDRHRPWAERYGFSIRFSPGRHEPAPHPDFRYNPTGDEILYLVGLFKHADVAVNLSSTVALESCMADRPVICAFFGKPLDWLQWRRSMVVRDFKEHYADLMRGGGVAVARSARVLLQQINAYLSDPTQDRAGRRRSAEIVATTVAGDARSRVLRLLQTLVG